jgi:hypothetical protein
MAARRSLVLETCMEYIGHGVQRPSNPYYPSKFFPSSLTLGQEEGLAWCRLGKVATTAWSAFFLLLREVPLHQIKVNFVEESKKKIAVAVTFLRYCPARWIWSKLG